MIAGNDHHTLSLCESGGMPAKYIDVTGAKSLHVLQLFLGHAEVMTEFMYERLANLMTNFCLI